MSDYQQMFSEVVTKGLVPLALLAAVGYFGAIMFQNQQNLIVSVCETGINRVLDKVDVAQNNVQQILNAQRNFLPTINRLLGLQESALKEAVEVIRAPARKAPVPPPPR